MKIPSRSVAHWTAAILDKSKTTLACIIFKIISAVETIEGVIKLLKTINEIPEVDESLEEISTVATNLNDIFKLGGSELSLTAGMDRIKAVSSILTTIKELSFSDEKIDHFFDVVKLIGKPMNDYKWYVSIYCRLLVLSVWYKGIIDQ